MSSHIVEANPEQNNYQTDNLDGLMEDAAIADTENRSLASEEMENRIQLILDRIDRFTQQVSETLEAGKTMFQELSAKLEEHLIEIHTEQIQKWQEEIKELRLLDASNEENHARLQNTRSHLLQNCHVDY